ncbi:MAG: hypothetical protein JNL96_18830 [Planctomycetaceae bacterium]|nr:hypothetical protein [Planctomycetaceae bacterium]
MKRLLLLAIVGVLTTSAIGCGICERFRRGPHCDTCPTAGSPYVPGPTVSAPATETYLPAPG